MPSKPWFALAAAGLLLIALGADVASAQETLPSTAPAVASTAPAEPTTLFPKGSFTVGFNGGYYVDIESPNERVNPYTLEARWYIKDGFAIGVDVIGYTLDAKNGFDDAGAGGFNLGLRHHVYERGDFSLFLEAAVGMVYADDEFPPGGTRFNYTEHAGVGVTYRLKDNLFFVGGGRFIHISNAYIHGRDQNPGINAFGGYAGLMWEF
jgi:hypothetical protein